MEMKLLGRDFDPRFDRSDTDSTVYLLMDGARFKNIHAFIYKKEDLPDYHALYRGTFLEKAVEVSPCLVRVQDMYGELLRWYVEEGANEKKAMLIVSDVGINDLTRHFQNFLEARLPSNKIVLFRFYDPGVFHAMAHLHKKQQIAALLEPCTGIYWKIEDAYYCLA
jgi:hypothetical protein